MRKAHKKWKRLMKLRKQLMTPEERERHNQQWREHYERQAALDRENDMAMQHLKDL